MNSARHLVQFSSAKKLFATALALVLSCTGLVTLDNSTPANAAACSSAASGYAAGDGTSGNPFQISTAAQLIYLSGTTADWAGKYFIQTASIDLDGCDWNPIGDTVTKFTGTYDGQGNSINDLYINRTSGPLDNVGLFGVISAATIKKLVIRGELTSNRNNMGGVVGAGTSASLSQISQIRSEVNIANTGGGYAGGIAGDAMGVNISYSSYSGSLSSSNQYGQIAGMVGYSGQGSARVTSSYVRANVSGASEYKSALGAWNSLVGSQLYAVTPGSNSGVSNSTGVSITNVFWNTTVGPATASRSGALSGATGKTTSEMVLRSTYANASWEIVDGWDVFTTTAPTKIWGICSQVNDGYPFLLWEYSSNPCTSAPTAPTITAITAGNAQLSIAFTPPSSDGGASVTNYKYSTDNGATWTAASPSLTTGPLVISGLTNGTTYSVKIRPVNSVGDGAASSAVSGTPVAPPSSSSGSSLGPVITNLTSKIVAKNKTQFLTLPGERLNLISDVWLGSQKLNFVRLTDNIVQIEVPAISSGEYDIKISSIYGAEVSYKAAVIVVAQAINVLQKVTSYSNLLGGKSDLPAKTRIEILKTIRAIPAVSRIVCVGSTSGARVTLVDRKLAKARAETACTLAKRVAPGAITSILTKPAAGVGARFRSVEIKVYSTK